MSLTHYSYQDCWNYALSTEKNIVVEPVKNDIITLCQTNPTNFWLRFSDKFLTTDNYSLICHNINKYLHESYPVPYLTKQVSFAGLSLAVEEGIFIPQKDTEIVVEKTLEIAERYWKNYQKLKVFDLGTGCGNIAISLAKSKLNWNFTASDINKKSLKMAKRNAKINQVKNIKFIASNLFAEIDKNERFDIIVANPPYVNDKEYEKLAQVVKKQPRTALVASNDGYFFYQEIFRQVGAFLNKKFLLALEIGQQQEKKIIKLLIDYFPKAKVSIFPDYQGYSRVLVVCQ